MTDRARDLMCRCAGALALLPLVISGCAVEPAFSLCPESVTAVTIFNHFGDSPIADQQSLVDRRELDATCRTSWVLTSPERRAFASTELSGRSVTVLVFDTPQGSRRKVWIHRLAGWNAGSAVLLDNGESFFVRQEVALYYAPNSTVVEPGVLPKR